MNGITVDVNNPESRMLLISMRTLNNFAHASKKASKVYDFDCILFDKSNNCLVSTNSISLMIWKVNDEELLKDLNRKCRSTWTFFKYNMVWQKLEEKQMDPRKFPMYKKAIPEYSKYAKINVESDFESSISSSDKWIYYMEYACLLEGRRFNPVWFRMLGNIEFSTIHFGVSSGLRSIMLKSKKNRMMVIISSYIDREIKIFDKK